MRRMYLSWPTVSPLPSSFPQPEEVESPVLSHFSSSTGVMLTSSLNSWITVSLSLTIVNLGMKGFVFMRSGLKVEYEIAEEGLT